MAGTDNTSDKKAETPSVPLYLAGGVITLCGALAAYSTFEMPDPGWLLGALLLAGLGFLFSYGSRRLGINATLVDLGFAGVILLLMAGLATGQISPQQFLPEGVNVPQMRLLCALVWGGTGWAWALRSDNRVMGCMVPAMAALGLSAENNLNDSLMVCFGVFILAVIFLLIHLNFLQNRARASLPERSELPVRLLSAQLAQTGVCGLIVLLLGLLVIIPAQAVFARLSLGQAIRRLTLLGKPGPAIGSFALHFSDDDSLQIGTGDAWSASPEVVMHVAPSDGQEHLWRGRTYDQYTGEGWLSSLEDQKQPANASAGNGGFVLPDDFTPGDGATPGVPNLTAVFKVLGDTGQFYYAALPRLVVPESSLARALRVCRDGRLDLANGGSVHFSYTVVSQPAPDPMQPDTQARLRQTGRNYPQEVRARYLPVGESGLPSAGDRAFYRQALSEALLTLPPGQRDPLDEALAIRAWVSARCIYSLAVPPIPVGVDHVHAFLGDTRRGYCDMFASSMAILCRTAGIPARLATGFAPGEASGDGFNLRGEDKHAWTEVYFPGAGWAAFDPTAGSRTDGSVPNAQSSRRNALLVWLSHLRLPPAEDLAPVLLLSGAIALILMYVVKTEFLDRRRAPKPGLPPVRGAQAAQRTALGRQYARLSRAGSRLGLPRRPSETPAEYAARAAPLLDTQARELGFAPPSALVQELTAAFTRACYGGGNAEPAASASWNRTLGQLEAAARTAWWHRLWRSLERKTDGT